jgi:hypothetical protein
MWLALVCLGFTGSVAADPDPDGPPPPVSADRYVPPAPKQDFGSTVRVGTAVGFVYGTPGDVLALGATAAIGQRFGRLGIEAEYSYLSFQQRQTTMSKFGDVDGDVGIGRGQRVDLMVRLDALRFGPTVDRKRSLVTLYVEGGAGIAWNHWSRAAVADGNQVTLADTKRTEGQAGFGIQIFPHRVAWLIGWRFAITPHEPMLGTICRGVSCRVMTSTDDSGGVVDRSMLFQSSLEFTF